MNKQEFLRKLEQSLRIKVEEKNEVMRYYTEYFEEAGPENEQAVLKELGDPRVLAEKLNAECKAEETQTEELWTEDPSWQEAIDEAEMALREAEIDVREAEIDVNEAKIEVDAARAEWEAAKKDVEEAKRVVNAIMAELQQAIGEAAETLEEELSEAEDELTEAEDVQTDADDALSDAMEELRDAEQELKDAERELRSAQRDAASARRGNGRENSRKAENIIDESLRFAERTTRSVFTSLKDIFGGGQTDKAVYKFSDYDMEPFHTIRVDVENCPVTVSLAENNQYGVDAKFVVGNQDEWEINVVDGTLTVKKHTSRRIRIHLAFSGNGEKNSEYVRIYLPKVTMDIVELTSSNGSIQVESVCAQTLIADTSNAMIRIEDTKALDELKADTSNGAIILSRVEGEDITLDTSNGAINLEQVTGRKLSADTSNGAIRAKLCELEERLLADTSNGSIEALLVGSEHEYNIHADTSNAKVYVDGQLRGDEYRSLGGAKEVRLDTSNGRITIGFVSRS